MLNAENIFCERSFCLTKYYIYIYWDFQTTSRHEVSYSECPTECPSSIFGLYWWHLVLLLNIYHQRSIEISLLLLSWHQSYLCVWHIRTCLLYQVRKIYSTLFLSTFVVCLYAKKHVRFARLSIILYLPFSKVMNWGNCLHWPQV